MENISDRAPCKMCHLFDDKETQDKEIKILRGVVKDQSEYILELEIRNKDLEHRLEAMTQNFVNA